MSEPTLVLASTSRYRAELLGRLGVPFETASPDFDERSFDARFGTWGPEEHARQLARGKVESLLGAFPRHVLLGADQLGVLPGPGDRPRLLHKPRTPGACVEQLLEMSGKTHELITAVVLHDTRDGSRREALDCQRLTMRPFGEQEARSYVEAFEPLDCAGGYRIEDAGIRLFERIEGEDFTGIIGLPLLAVARLLREVGLLPGDRPRTVS